MVRGEQAPERSAQTVPEAAPRLLAHFVVPHHRLILAPKHVRGLHIATVQYSSFCGCASGLMLGVLDIMEVEVQDREQVDVREKVDARETEEEDKTKKQQTLKHVMTCA